MEMGAAEAEAAIRAGIAALQRGDAAEAKRLLGEVATRGSPVPPPYFLLAQACRHSGDEAGEAAALDQVLESQPRNIGALIMRGDGHARAGDRRSAASFYRAAIQTAAAGAQLSPILASELARAEAAAADIDAEFAAHLESRLGAAGGRVRDAVDILLGRKQVYLQQPTSFYFPGLPQIEFYEREAFPWLAGMEAAIPDMRAELQAALAADLGFVPYVESDPNRPPATHELLGDPSWSAFHLWRKGEPVADNAANCPAAMSALESAPMPRIRGRSPMALFSVLRAGARIAPHNGLLNTRLICHIPLIVPDGCALRVGNQVRAWEEGKALVFDDSIEHEAWNGSPSTRVILLFEIWRPEIGEGERQALTALFEAITDFGSSEGVEEG
jgi:aspartyl/asparaginyl beta-hydroxylase (cupin superfamily)